MNVILGLSIEYWEMRFRTNNLFQNLYILLDILVYSIAEYFNKMCSILSGSQGQVKNTNKE